MELFSGLKLTNLGEVNRLPFYIIELFWTVARDQDGNCFGMGPTPLTGEEGLPPKIECLTMGVRQ